MKASGYVLWGIGQPVGKGVMGARHVGVAGIAKTGSLEQPYAVANEVLCAQLGRGICLPVPAGVVTQHGGNNYYLSLNVKGGHQLPEADPEALVAANPHLACGILVFDVWIGNGDRHTNNLSYDSITGEVHLFDHGHAFTPAGNPCTFWNENGHRIFEKHCLAPVVTDLQDLAEWIARVESVPAFYIKDAVDSACSVGLPEAFRTTSIDFLLSRRDNLRTIFQQHRNAFPRVINHLPFDSVEGE